MVLMYCPKLLKMSKCRVGVELPPFLDKLQKEA